MKNEFVSVISHELRTPLTSIRGSLGLLEGGVGGQLSEDGQELVRIARSNSERLIRLINDILDLDKLEAGRLEFRNEPVRPASLIRDALAESQRFADEAGIELRATQSDELPEIQGDPDRLLQVLVKLTDNAIKFSPSPSSVCVGARVTEQGLVRFEIIDQGPGIPPEQHKRLFKKFQQLESHSTRRSGGSGLGLVICKAIVDAHRGQLGLVSDSGEGSTFFVEFAPAGSRLAVRPPASGRGISARTVDMNLAHVPDTKTRGLAEDLAELGADVVKAFEAGEVGFLRDLHQRARELAADLNDDAPGPLGPALLELAEALEHTDESLQRRPIEDAFSNVLRASRGLD
jgi:hypothetical protein